MSSYQFVNPMSCYGGRAQDVSAAVAADYYGAAVNTYDACYSPPLNSYGAYPPAVGPLPAGAQAADFLASASLAAAATGALHAADDEGNSTPGPSATHPRLHQNSSSSPTATTQQNNSTPSATSASSSNIPCNNNTKFATTPESGGAVPVGSPQDLTIAGEGAGGGSQHSYRRRWWRGRQRRGGGQRGRGLHRWRIYF